MAASRRAAARAAAAAAAEPPQPPVEEPPSEPAAVPAESEVPPEKSPSQEQLEKDTTSKHSTSKSGKAATDRITETINIFLVGQAPYTAGPSQISRCQAPPQTPHCHCHCHCESSHTDTTYTKRKKGKGRRAGKENGPCNHPFCIAQRARTGAQGLPWVTITRPPGIAGSSQCCQCCQPETQPPFVISQRPVPSCCPKCCNPREDCDSE